MIKNITAVFLAFILATGGGIYWMKSFMGIDIFQLWNQKETVRNTKQMTLKPEIIESPVLEGIDAQIQEQLDKYSTKDMGDLSPEELETVVIKKYQSAFVVMEKGYETKINDLMLTAITEYKSLSKQEKKNAMLTLGLEYLNHGAALEEASDKSFNRVLAQMRQELEENNLSIDILMTVKNQYEQEKNERRELLMEKDLGQIK